MYRNIRRAMAVMFGLALSAAMTFSASAQEDPMQDMTQDAPVMGSVADDYGKGCCDDCCYASGSIYAEFQYVYLDAYSNAVGVFAPHVNEQDGIRAIAGYTGCDGLGLRARYFNFDGVDNTVGLDAEYIDIELTESISICNLNGVLSAGYRHAQYEVVQAGGNLIDFEGDGVTFGAQFERNLGCGLGAYVWVQHSILFGDENVLGNGDEILNWTEAQLGAQYSTCFGGYDAFLRGGVEAQSHSDIVNTNSSTGLVGLFISAGLNF